jgi:hypothetical protein
MTLRKAKSYVRSYIRDWTDEKLAQVLAFASDEKMDYYHPCRCLIGVGTSKIPHSVECEGNHYEREFLAHPQGREWVRRAEWSYKFLGLPSDCKSFDLSLDKDQYLRDRRFVAILKAEIRLRDRRKKTSRPVEEGVEVATA